LKMNKRLSGIPVVISVRYIDELVSWLDAGHT